MKIIFNTDNGPVTIDPATVSQFVAISENKTQIEHKTNLMKQTHTVNHDLHQVATVVLGITGQQP